MKKVWLKFVSRRCWDTFWEFPILNIFLPNLLPLYIQTVSSCLIHSWWKSWLNVGIIYFQKVIFGTDGLGRLKCPWHYWSSGSSATHPYCTDEIRQGKVLVTKDSPTVPDRKGDIISGHHKKIKLYEDKKQISVHFYKCQSVHECCRYLIWVLLTGAVSVSTMTGIARLKKQFLNNSNP